MSDPTVALAEALISRRSVTPDDAGCLDLIGERLAPLGFTLERLRFGQVDNLWARVGHQAPVLVLAGHTDVVPPGPIPQWQSDPFEPKQRGGYLYGRGAADMKGALAAMVVGVEDFLRANATYHGSLAFLLTSDEEGPATDGTVKVVETLQQRGERIDYCLIGEPSSRESLGDEIKNGRRGSLTGRLRVIGQQGHVAYPEQVRNPIHAAAEIVSALNRESWDRGNSFFPPTSFQVANFNAGTGAENVVPAQAEIQFNLRFSSESTDHGLRARVEQIINAVADERGEPIDTELEWRLSGQPFLTEAGELVAAACAAIGECLSREPKLSTAGGTSDGRFIAPMGAQVLEFGPVNATIHQIDECVRVADLEALRHCYRRIIERLLT